MGYSLTLLAPDAETAKKIAEETGFDFRWSDDDDHAIWRESGYQWQDFARALGCSTDWERDANGNPIYSGNIVNENAVLTAAELLPIAEAAAIYADDPAWARFEKAYERANDELEYEDLFWFSIKGMLPDSVYDLRDNMERYDSAADEDTIKALRKADLEYAEEKEKEANEIKQRTIGRTRDAVRALGNDNYALAEAFEELLDSPESAYALATQLACVILAANSIDPKMQLVLVG